MSVMPFWFLMKSSATNLLGKGILCARYASSYPCNECSPAESAESLWHAVQEVRAEVLRNPDGALEALAASAWPQMAASSHAQLQLFISLLTDICRVKVLLQTWPKLGHHTLVEIVETAE